MNECIRVLNQVDHDGAQFIFCLFLACRSRQASIVLETYFRFEMSLLSILCMLITRMEMGTSRVSGDSDILTLTTEHVLDGNGRVIPIMRM